MIDTSKFKTGLKIEVEDAPHVIIEHQHVKPGKGGAFVRTKLRNMLTGAVIDRTYKSGEKFQKSDLQTRKMQYLYQEGTQFHFMDAETFDQMFLDETSLGDKVKWMQENIEVDALVYKGNVIDIELPNTVEMAVKDCPPAFKGDTASGSGKPATMETGAVVTVPYFVEVGDVLRIDTRTGNYIERA